MLAEDESDSDGWHVGFAVEMNGVYRHEDNGEVGK